MMHLPLCGQLFMDISVLKRLTCTLECIFKSRERERETKGKERETKKKKEREIERTRKREREREQLGELQY